MNSPEESAVRDLARFTSNVLNGMLDMHKSAADLIRYSFTVRTVKDVVRRGSEDPELINQIADSLNHLVIYLNEEIVVYAKRASPAGMESRHFNELLKRLNLLYEIWLAMCLRPEYQDFELMKHVEASKEAMGFTYKLCEGYHRWEELPLPLQEFFLGRKQDVKSSVEEAEPTLFAREDGVVSSLAHEQAQSDDDGKKRQFVAKTEKVLNNYRAKNPDFKTMRELVNAKTPFRLEDTSADHLINDFIVVWNWAIDYPIANISDKYLFTALLKKIFLLIDDKRKNDFASKLYDKYVEDGNEILPCLENFIENFQSGLTDALNKMPLDANVISNQLSKFEEIKDPLLWYLVVSPVTTLQQLLMMCIDNKGYVPLVARVCRSLQTLFARSVHITPLPHEDPNSNKGKVLISMLHRVFLLGRMNWTTAAQWENAAFMAMSLAKKRKKNGVISEAPEDAALIDTYSLVKFALEELLKGSRKPPKAVEVICLMLQRLLANNNNARMLSNFQFATSLAEMSEENVLPTVPLIQLMFTLLVEYDGKSKVMSDCARDILKSVGGRMEAEKVVFDPEICSYLTDETFNSSAWWVKYSIHTWFSSSLNNPKRQIPSGIYQVLTDDQKDHFEQIKSEEVSTVSECYFKSLFELGLFDVDLAIELLRIGYSVNFGKTDVVETMGLALVDSYGRKMAKCGGGVEIVKLINEMLKVIDPIRELVPLKSYNNSYMDSTRKIEHILILFKAARIAREKKLCAARVRTNETRQASFDDLLSLDEVSEQLMDVCCETAKTHIEKEADEIAKLRDIAGKIIFDTPGASTEQINIMIEKEEREQSMVMQLTLLYLTCSHFTRLYQDVPIKLKQLMNSTLEKQFDSQKLLANRVLDDVLTEQRKSEVVYVFAEPPQEQKQEPEAEKEVIEPIKPSELITAKQPQHVPIPGSESTSAENTMFHFNGGEKHRYGKGPAPYRNNNPRKNYQNYPDNERQSSSRGPKTDRVSPSMPYRDRRYGPVNDPQLLAPKYRDTLYKTKFPMNKEYDRSLRDDHSRRSFYPDKLYYDDISPTFESDDVRRSEVRSNDARRFSESRDPWYDGSWDNGANRHWPSDSEFSHEDAENSFRMFDKTLRSVHNFSQRDFLSTRAGPSDSSPPKSVPEGKPKKGFGGEQHGRFYGHQRKQFDRKHREFAQPDYEQQQEGKKVLRNRMPEKEELAHAYGYSDRSNVPKSRRGPH